MPSTGALSTAQLQRRENQCQPTFPQGGIKCGNRGTGFLDSEGSYRQRRPQTYAVLSRKRTITTFLSQKYMITRLSIAPQVMPQPQQRAPYCQTVPQGFGPDGTLLERCSPGFKTRRYPSGKLSVTSQDQRVTHYWITICHRLSTEGILQANCPSRFLTKRYVIVTLTVILKSKGILLEGFYSRRKPTSKLSVIFWDQVVSQWMAVYQVSRPDDILRAPNDRRGILLAHVREGYRID